VFSFHFHQEDLIPFYAPVLKSADCISSNEKKEIKKRNAFKGTIYSIRMLQKGLPDVKPYKHVPQLFFPIRAYSI